MDSARQRIGPLIQYVCALHDHYSKSGNHLVLDVTQTIGSTKVLSATDLGTHWLPLTNKPNVHFSSIRLCNLGIRHPHSRRPVKGAIKLFHRTALPPLHECQCGRPREDHLRMPSRYNDENILLNKQVATIILFLCDGMLVSRRPFLDHTKVHSLLQTTLPQMSSNLQKLLRQWQLTSGRSSDTADSSPSVEISPEATELEAFPTNARLKQKEKENRFWKALVRSISPPKESRRSIQAQMTVARTSPPSTK